MFLSIHRSITRQEWVGWKYLLRLLHADLASKLHVNRTRANIAGSFDSQTAARRAIKNTFA